MECNLIDDLERTSRRLGHKTALTENGENECTYAALRQTARRAGTALAHAGMSRRTILVAADRSVQAVQAMFAVLYAGSAYAPLDISSPTARIADICAALDRPPVICTRKQLERCRALAEMCGRVLVWEELTGQTEDDALLEELRSKTEPEQTMCVLFTSGSTGVPKGVVKTHRAMDRFEDAFVRQFGLGENDCWGNQSPFYFDASAKELYSSIRTGATLHILPTGLFSQPLGLVRRLDELGINAISWVPSALCIITRMDTFSTYVPKSLERVFFVGEVFPVEHFRQWQAALPHTVFTNLYGPTETAGVACWCTLPPACQEDTLPIGRPLEGVTVELHAPDGGLVEQLETQGEVWIGGPTLAKEYLNDPVRTAAAFVEQDGLRFYRTGDFARRNGRGELVFCSRADHQIKHMGHRIELGEIEARAERCAGVDRCCCVYDAPRQRLVLFYQGSAPLKDLYVELRRELPRYMVPARLVPCDALPCNANGKLDRTAMQRQAADI